MMKMKVLSMFLAVVIIFLQLILVLPVKAAGTPTISYQPYNWGNVAIGGGGYITGLVIHPRYPNLVYARTDVGGVYRWDEANQKWNIITDGSVINCADGIAIDEKNPDNVYLYAGNNESYQGIYKSTDKGKTWTKCYTVTANANALHRWKGEPIAVDPNNSNIIYCGTRDNGLLKSTDGGVNWTAISTSVIPKGEAVNGIRVVVYDRFGAVAGGVTQKMYVSVSGDGIYRTKDGGKTWEPIGGEKDVSRMVVDRNGNLIVGGSTGLYRYNGSKWNNISPEQGKGIAGIDVDSGNPDRLVAVRNQKFPDDVFKLPIFRSEDGGKTWYNTSTSMTKQNDVPWWPDTYFSAATSCVLFDPLNSNKVYLSDWYGVWMTSNFWDSTVDWYTKETGHEETVVLGLSCPPSGAPLFSGLADVNGFRHTDITTYPQNRSTVNQESTSIDYCETDPNYMIRTEDNGHGASGAISISSDNGVNWQAVTSWTYGLAIRSAYSSTDTNTMVVLTSEGTPKRTIDGGNTWQESIGAPATSISGIWPKQPQPLAADKVNGSKFYYYAVQGGVGKLFVSTNKGLNWTAQAQNLPTTGGALRARPGVEGELLLATGSGLYRSTDSGATFSAFSGITAVKALTYGKAALGSSIPAIYINGTINGQAGLFRSDDDGANWIKMNTDSCIKMLDCIRIEGDRQTYGRIYGATGGRGIYYGDIAGEVSTTAPTTPPAPTPGASVNGNLVFEDDFDSYVLGTAPSAWNISSGSDVTSVIESVNEPTYRKYLSVRDESTVSKVEISKSHQAVDKEITAKWEYKTETVEDQTEFILGNGTVQAIRLPATGLAMSANTWHEIKIVGNIAAQTYDVFLDNTMVISGVGFLQNVSSMNRFTVATTDSATAAFQLDNLSIDGTFIENAAMPVTSPAPGFYSGITNVTLSCSTPGTAIYYTTDGSVPTSTSNIFTTSAAIVIDRNTVISAKAVAPGYKDSEVAVYRFYYGTKLFEDQFMNETAGAAPSQWTTAVSAVIEPNLLLNAGFENGTVNGIIAGWERASQTGSPKVAPITPGHSGNNAGEGKAGDSNSAYTYSLDQVVNGIPNGTTYKYSGWFKYSGSAFNDQSSFSATYGSYTKAMGFGAPGSPANKYISPIKVTNPISTDWQKFEITGVAVTANTLRLKIWMNNPAGMNLQFDDMMFTGGNKNYAKLVNSDALLSKQINPSGSVHAEWSYSFDKDMPVEFSFGNGENKIVKLYSNGTKLGYYDANGSFIEIMDVIPSKWYNLKMGIDKFDSRKFYLYVDGMLKGENFSFSGQAAPIDAFSIATPSTVVSGTVLINNVSIYGTSLKSLLSSDINAAQLFCDHAVEGLEIGNYPVGSKAGLYDAISAATNVLNNPASTDAQVVEARTELNLVVEEFKGLLILANPAVSPTALNFDKNPAVQQDAVAFISWNGASQVTDVKNGETSLGIQSFNVNGDVLAISKDYLAAQPEGNLVLTVLFDKGAPAILGITIADTTPPSPAEMPVANPTGGVVAFGSAVTLTSGTTGAAIYYTMDGSTPTASSTQYTEPIIITGGAIIKAIAVKDGMTVSEVMSESYTIPGTVAIPVANPASGAVALGSLVTLTCSTTDAAIYYTLDGSTPSASSSQYTGPIIINGEVTIKAIAEKDGMTASGIMSESYTQAATQDLTNILLSGEPSNYTFAGGTYTYTGVTVGNSVSGITVTPNGAGTITVDGIPVTSGQASALISLEKGIEKTITIISTEAGKTPKTYRINVTRQASSGNSSGENGNPVSGHTTVQIIFNGESQTGTTATVTKVDGKIVITVIVDNKKVKEGLQNQGPQTVIKLPVKNDADIVIGQLDGQTIKAMEKKEAVLQIETSNVTYTLPSAQIDIDHVAKQFGNNVKPEDILFNIKISAPQQDMIQIIETTANRNNYQLVTKPVEFEITCTHGDMTVEVSQFNGYVERMLTIPEGINPGRITTGVVLNSDGTFSHVPTSIIQINNKYYAKINSLTNSTYATIWSPKTFKDVENHWAEAAVNDMGSRLIIGGISEDRFEPDRESSRAEFAAIIVKALGLMHPGAGKNIFSDVKKGSWYYDAVSTACEYGIISGYGNGKFGPMDKITREQAMTMIVKAMEIAGLKAEISIDETEKLLTAFIDGEKASDWAKNAIAACVKTEIISGRSGNLIASEEYITRAEVAVIVRKLLQKSKLI